MAPDDADEGVDVDLVIETAFDTSDFVLWELLMGAQDLLGCRVDVVTEKSLHPPMRDRIHCKAQAL